MKPWDAMPEREVWYSFRVDAGELRRVSSFQARINTDKVLTPEDVDTLHRAAVAIGQIILRYCIRDAELIMEGYRPVLRLKVRR